MTDPAPRPADPHHRSWLASARWAGIGGIVAVLGLLVTVVQWWAGAAQDGAAGPRPGVTTSGWQSTTSAVTTSVPAPPSTNAAPRAPANSGAFEPGPDTSTTGRVPPVPTSVPLHTASAAAVHPSISFPEGSTGPVQGPISLNGHGFLPGEDVEVAVQNAVTTTLTAGADGSFSRQPVAVPAFFQAYQIPPAVVVTATGEMSGASAHATYQLVAE
jgi:hypothetical protein